MGSGLDEGFQAMGRDVRELAGLHRDLARAEVCDGLASLVRGMFCAGLGLVACSLALIAVGVAAYSWLAPRWTAAVAALAVAGAYAVVAAVALRAGWKLLAGFGSVLLPRTRALLWEWITCRDEPTDS